MEAGSLPPEEPNDYRTWRGGVGDGGRDAEGQPRGWKKSWVESGDHQPQAARKGKRKGN